MNVTIILSGGQTATAAFPMNDIQLSDIADRLRGNPEFDFRISEFENLELPMSLCGKYYKGDLKRLNLFAERLEKLDNMGEAQMTALTDHFLNADLDDLIQMTYGLDSVPTWPCNSENEMTEIAFTNGWLPELANCPYEVIDMLDGQKVCERVSEERNGTIINGYYIEPAEYVCPNVQPEYKGPSQVFFRLLLAAPDRNGGYNYGSARWLSLPCPEIYLNDFEEEMGAEFEKMCVVDRQSSLPYMSPYQIGTEKIYELNELANTIKKLPHSEIMKLKAVMQLENISIISDTKAAIRHLTEYDFDIYPHDESEFGRKYFAMQLPTNFDFRLLNESDMHDLGRNVLQTKGGDVTDYGAVSGRGQVLYSVVSQVPEQSVSKECEDDESESESEGLGVCLT